MATKAEVEFWKERVRKLVKVLDAQRESYYAVIEKLHDNTEEVKTMQAVADGLEWEIEDLRKLARGLMVCADSDADARTDCPLYDESEPNRCAKDRLVSELGLES